MTAGNNGSGPEAAAFLRAIWGDPLPGALNFWRLADRRSFWFATIDDAAAWIAAEEGRLGGPLRDLYHGVALAPSRKGEFERVTAAEAAAIPGPWGDVDVGGDRRPPSVEAALEALAELPVRPSVAVSSGGGVHVYAVLKEPWPLSSPEERARAARIVAAFQSMIRTAFQRRGWGLDDTSDLARVLRIPGTLNAKREPLRPVGILFTDGPRYGSPEELEEALEPWMDIAEEPHQGPADDGEPIPEGQRNDKLYRIGCALRRMNFAEEEILGALRAVNARRCRPPVEEDELRRCATNATLHEPDQKATLLAEGFQNPLAAAPFPTEAFPPWLRRFVEALAVKLQVPVDLPAALALAVLALTSQRRFEVRIDEEYQEPLSLFVLVAMLSAERKSAALRAIIKPAQEFERKLIEEQRPTIARARAERALLEEKIRSLRKLAAKHEENECVESELFALEAKLAMNLIPASPRLVADDVTPEAITLRLSEQHERLGVFSAEGGIFATIAGRYADGVANLDAILKAHAGDAVRVDRRSGEALVIDRPALTLGLAVQPKILRDLPGRKGFRDLGLLARFCFSEPESNVGFRQIRPPAVGPKILEEYRQGLLAMLALGYGPCGEPEVFKVSAEGLEVWSRFAAEVESHLRDAGRLFALRDWGGKAPGLAARIAGLLHLADHPGKPPESVPASTVERGIAITRYFQDHAERILGREESLADRERRELVQWIRKQGGTCTPRDLARGPRRFRGEGGAAIEALEDLAKRRIGTITEGPPEGGGPPVLRFTLRTENRPSPKSAVAGGSSQNEKKRGIFIIIFHFWSSPTGDGDGRFPYDGCRHPPRESIPFKYRFNRGWRRPIEGKPPLPRPRPTGFIHPPPAGSLSGGVRTFVPRRRAALPPLAPRPLPSLEPLDVDAGPPAPSARRALPLAHHATPGGERGSRFPSPLHVTTPRQTRKKEVRNPSLEGGSKSWYRANLWGLRRTFFRTTDFRKVIVSLYGNSPYGGFHSRLNRQERYGFMYMRDLNISLHGLGRVFTEALHLPESIFSGWFYGGALPLRRAAVKSNRGLVALDSKELTALTFACAIAKAGGKGRRVGRAFILVRDGLTGLKAHERAFLVADVEAAWFGIFIATEHGTPRAEQPSHFVLPLSSLEVTWRTAIDTRPESESAAATIKRVLTGVDLHLSPPLPAEAAVEPVEGGEVNA